jgi:hypothetical protein
MEIRPDAKCATRSVRRYTFWITLLFVAAFTFLDYWSYSTAHRTDPQGVERLASGLGDAPAQYRIAVIYTAKYLGKLVHGHLAFRHFFAIFDFIAALLSCLLIRDLMFRSAAFCGATRVSQMFRATIVLGLALYYLMWSMWYQRPETWTSVLFVAASLYVISAIRSPAVVFSDLVVLAVVQGFVRSDVAILFHFALFLYVLIRGADDFPVGRWVLLAASCVSGLLSTAILWIIMHRIFPHATYGTTKVFQLPANLTPNQFLPFALFFIPIFYTYVRGKASGAATRAGGQTLLLASIFYLASWVLVGRIAEVRIFIPFAFALMPQTSNALADGMELPEAFLELRRGGGEKIGVSPEPPLTVRTTLKD